MPETEIEPQKPPQKPPIPDPDLDSRGRTAIERMANKTSREIAKALQAERERDDARRESDDLRKQIADLSKANGEIEALKTQLRATKHRAVADQALRDAGISDARAIEDFYKVSEMKFEGDEPDPKVIGEFVEAQKAERPYLFGASHQGDDETPRPGPGRGRGGNGNGDNGQFQATEAQLRDPNWCFENQAKLAKISKEVANMPIARIGEKFTVV